MQRRRLCLLSILWLLCVAAMARAQPAVTVQTEYYDIYGWTAEELREQMVRFGVVWRDGKTYDALTTWTASWRYSWESGPSRCRITAVETSVAVLHRYPRWVNKKEAGPGLQHRWERYMAHLATHENGHKNIGIAATAAIEQAIRQMPALSNCQALEAAANGLAEEVLDTYRAQEASYDQQTGHGRTQGAVFP
ncbi:DUF922 domain-containing Zn-dependent protease [Desulfoluna spongiiphila]|uniref:Predicted secreted Zn-dependent protease n=1 Tax=Desulfoluna spongiiphila TaxID=419481 RepID=A0A1G5BH83_9BACT|nr:DUF922 domain-containing Zn-dependent protease [Desulfoluna spongiiphila]SCX89525.1 Predicted secreted Zn-dependent protease [Desulfoluna spongiiphila]